MTNATARGLVHTESSQKLVRLVLGGEVIADTDDALYVWEGLHYPQYYVPMADVDDGALVPSATTRRSPSQGTASYFTGHGGGRQRVDGAWTYANSPIGAVRGRVRFKWSAAGAWFEEDEEVLAHPRSPLTGIQILPSSRLVVVTVDGITVAESDRPTFLHETRLRRRTYLPKLDVRMDMKVPTETTSMCPYKGGAVWWSLVTPTAELTDLAWSYPTTHRESAPIAGQVAFYDERVEVTVDGVRAPGT